jgi:hypothetical protein
MAKASADKSVANKVAEPPLGDLLKQILDRHPGQPRGSRGHQGVWV